MDRSRPISMPRFALPLFYERVRCRFCEFPVRETDLLFVGAGRDREAQPCFAYEYQCSSCRKFHTVVDTTHRFTRPDWWNELTAWNNATPTVSEMSAASSLARRTLPKIGPMVLGADFLESAWVRGGYKGDIGPILLIAEGTEKNTFFGVLRLERGGRVSMFNLGDQFCLPRLDLGRFAAVADGGTFPLDGRNWIKMSAKEIEEIIRDRVFEVLSVPDCDELVRTPKVSARASHGSTHAPKGRKGTRRPPRNPRPMDS